MQQQPLQRRHFITQHCCIDTVSCQFKRRLFITQFCSGARWSRFCVCVYVCVCVCVCRCVVCVCVLVCVFAHCSYGVCVCVFVSVRDHCSSVELPGRQHVPGFT